MPVSLAVLIILTFSSATVTTGSETDPSDYFYSLEFFEGYTFEPGCIHRGCYWEEYQWVDWCGKVTGSEIIPPCADLLKPYCERFECPVRGGETIETETDKIEVLRCTVYDYTTGHLRMYRC